MADTIEKIGITPIEGVYPRDFSDSGYITGLWTLEDEARAAEADARLKTVVAADGTINRPFQASPLIRTQTTPAFGNASVTTQLERDQTKEMLIVAAIVFVLLIAAAK